MVRNITEINEFLKEKLKSLEDLSEDLKTNFRNCIINNEILSHEWKYLPLKLDNNKKGYFCLEIDDKDKFDEIVRKMSQKDSYNENAFYTSTFYFLMLGRNKSDGKFERGCIIRVGYGVTPVRSKGTVKILTRKILTRTATEIKRKLLFSLLKEFLFKDPEKIFQKTAIIEHFINYFLGIKEGSVGLVNFYKITDDFDAEEFDKFDWTLKFLNRLVVLFLLNSTGLIRSRVFNNYKKFYTSKDEREECLEKLLTEIDVENLMKVFEKINYPENGASYEIVKINYGSLSVELVLPYLDSEIFQVFGENVQEEVRAERKFIQHLVKKLKEKENREVFNRFVEFLASFTWTVKETLTEEKDQLLGVDPEVLSALYEKIAIFFDVYKREKKKLDPRRLKEILDLYIANKEKGVYYTPAIITEYITENTIIPWLKDKLIEKGISAEFKTLLDFLEWIKGKDENVKERVLEIIKDIKVLDPAVGSGGFLMPAGDILFEIRRAVDKNFDPIKTAKEIVTGSLYGVDILPGAIEICKFRMWLWILSKAAKEFDREEISGTEYKTLATQLVLPNIEYNFRVGNSLIGFTSIPNKDVSSQGITNKLKKIGINTTRTEEILNLKEKWTEKYKKGDKEVVTKLNQLQEILQEIFDDKFAFEYKIKKEELTTLSPFHWIFEFPEVFLEKGGFDVVVGNPPYGKIKNMKLQEEEKFFLSSVYKSLYQNIGTNVDFYKIFLKRSLTLTCDGKGYFSFLMPIMFWGDADSYDLRKEFYNFFILKILHFPLETTVKLFSGAINYEVSIFILKKNRTQSNFELRVSSYISSEDVRNLCNINFYKLEKSYVFKTSILGRLPLFQKAEYEKSILGFMRERFKPFGEYYNGESLGFILEGKLHETNDKKYLSSKPTGELAIASNHIKDWFVDLIPREEEKRWIKNGVKFRKRKVRDSIFNVENIGQLMDINPKIIGRQMANRGEKKKLHFMIHSGNEILTNGVRIIILKNRDVIFNKFFLALINSNLLDWQFKVYSLTYNVKPYELFDLFILNPQELILSGLSLIVDYILFSTALFRLNVEDGIYQQFFICLLNVEVFELYFKEKFYKDGLYPEQKEYLLELVLRYLKPINYDRWAELYWKKQLEGNLTEKEEKELVKLERENLATIQEVYQKLSKDKEIQAQIEKIKSHEWVKIIEGSS